MDLFLAQNRLMSAKFYNEKKNSHRILVALRRNFRWSNTLCDVALEAYYEFMELKIVLHDWDTISILPSWVVSQVWLLVFKDAVNYNEKCMKLCGHVISHQDTEEFTEKEKLQLIEQTKKYYLLRFNRPMLGSVWSYSHDIHWWKGYDKTLSCDKIFSYKHGFLLKTFCRPCFHRKSQQHECNNDLEKKIKNSKKLIKNNEKMIENNKKILSKLTQLNSDQVNSDKHQKNRKPVVNSNVLNASRGNASSNSNDSIPTPVLEVDLDIENNIRYEQSVGIDIRHEQPVVNNIGQELLVANKEDKITPARRSTRKRTLTIDTTRITRSSSKKKRIN